MVLNRFLRVPQVMDLTGVKRTKLHFLERDGLWPKGIKIAGESSPLVGWTELEVAQMNAARIAGKTDDEIRVLVRKIEADRSKAAE